MGRGLTKESKITAENEGKKEPKFNVELPVKTFNKLIDYLLLTENPNGRNKLINELIEERLKDKLLTNHFIYLREKRYFFNLRELLENKKVIATPNPILHNQKEIYVVGKVPNNLDDFNKDLETYCVGNNKNIHAGYYILPAYNGYTEKHFTFRFDAEKEEIEINLVPPSDIDTLFNPLDDDKQEIKERLIFVNLYRTHSLKNNEFTSFNMRTELNVFFNYELNLELEKLRKKEETEPLTDDEKAEREKIFFDAVFF